MKVLAISRWCLPYHAGGLGVLCYQLCAGLVARGHEVVVMTMDLATKNVPAGRRCVSCPESDAEKMLQKFPASIV